MSLLMPYINLSIKIKIIIQLKTCKITTIKLTLIHLTIVVSVFNELNYIVMHVYYIINKYNI